MTPPPAVPREPFEVRVPEADAGQRLDRVLAALVPAVSRALFQRWIAEGRVACGGQTVRAKDRARAGAVVRVEPAPPPPSEVSPQDIPLDIEFEDAYLVVVHKPAGLVVHPAPGHREGTLVNALRFHVSFPDAFDPSRPGIVHRLDRDTSGLMVVAKTEVAREGLVAQFQAHTIERAYWALVHGDLPERVTFEGLHGRHPVDRKRFSGRVARGKRAVTHVRKVRAWPKATLIECVLETGRTHQIRVHLSEAGHPIVADPIYGRPEARGPLAPVAEAIGRLALHARVLGFDHPISGQRVHFEREPPADFARALAILEQAKAG